MDLKTNLKHGRVKTVCFFRMTLLIVKTGNHTRFLMAGYFYIMYIIWADWDFILKKMIAIFFPFGLLLTTVKNAAFQSLVNLHRV